jgi:hypothetical protein
VSLNDTGEIGGRQARVYSDPAWDDLRNENNRLKAEVAALKDALETQVYHFDEAMNNENCGPWYESVQDAKKLLK